MADGTNLGSLHARLEEVEPGLFKAVYVDETADRGGRSIAIPDSHIGIDRDGVRHWVEQMATQLGFRAVVWDHDDGTP